MTVILTIIVIALGMGLLVGFHEAAHMAASKLLRVKVNRFSLGFGPVLLSRLIGETSYELRLLPLGGFVQCEGESPSSRAERGLFSLPWWKRSLIALAGPIASLLLGYAIMFALLVFGRGWPVLGGLAKAWELCQTVIVETVKFMTGHSDPGAGVSGPVMIVKILADSLKEGFVRFGSVLGLISLSLGFFNLLPIPALDGGHVLLYALEGIRGRKFKARVYEVWDIVGSLLLLGLMLYTVFGDVFAIWGKK